MPAYGDIVPSRGAVAKPLVIEVVRDLTEADLHKLVDGEKNVGLHLGKLRTIHHQQARLLAEGRSISMVAALTDRTPQRITQLMADPAFADLVERYRTQIHDKAMDAATRAQIVLTDNSELAAEEINRRLEDPEIVRKIPIPVLVKITESGFDRTVAPPKGAPAATITPTTITLNFGGKGINPEVQQKTLDNAQNSDIIDVTPKAQPVSTPSEKDTYPF
jgi:hypothetical protein